MNAMQRVIKYLAIALAIGIIFSIVSGVLGAISLVAGIASVGEEKVEAVDSAFGPFEGIENLSMEIGAADIYIRAGDELRAETDNPYIELTTRGATLVIREKSHFANLEGSTLILYIPEGLELSDVDMQTGAGRITCEALNCRELDLELGAGEAELGSLTVTGEADIEGGAGRIVIRSGSLSNLRFDMGLGEARITAAFTGSSRISAGIGSLELTLLSGREDYTIRTEQGIGRITLDGMAISGNSTTGSGNNRIELNGGIGNIDIDFNEPA